MKFSKYNIFSTQNNKIIVYNTITEMILEFDKDFFLSLKNHPSEILNIIHKNDKKYILNSKIIADDEIEKNNIIKNKLVEAKSVNTISLFITPTLFCNMNCIYCFQSAYKKSEMTQDIANQTIQFTKVLLKSKKTNILNIVWTGGEALLKVDLIKYMSCNIKKILDNNISFQQKVITNGLLLNENNIKILNETGISSIQITVDGLSNTHNQRRTSNKYNSFDKITQNIDNLLLNYSNIHLALRINIDKSNLNSYIEILTYLNHRYVNKNYSVTPCFVEQFDNMNIDDRIHNILSHDEQTKFLLNAGRLYYDSLPIDFLPQRKSANCMLKRKYSFAIGADGSVYKCYIDVGNLTKRIGHINNPSFLKNKFYLSDIKISNKCYDCSLFPVCNGSCPKKISTLNNNKNEHCHIAKGYEKKFLKFYMENIIK